MSNTGGKQVETHVIIFYFFISVFPGGSDEGRMGAITGVRK